MVSQLSDHAAAPGIPPERQSTLDEHVRSRIQTELAHLRSEEEEVRSEIERALEKENLDKERAMTEAEEDGGASGVTLLGDLEEIQEKVQRSKQKQNAAEVEAAQQASAEVILCYKCALVFYFTTILTSATETSQRRLSIAGNKSATLNSP